MIMKKIIYILLLASCGWSCSNFLDVNPKAEVIDDDMFSTASGVEDALYGVYSSLSDGSLYGSYLSVYYPELMAQNFVDDGIKGTKIGMLELGDLYLEDQITSIWKQAYRTIGYVNNIIINLEKKEADVFKHYNVYLGEALGLRAFLHFDLLRYYAVHVTSKDEGAKAHAIPYVTTYEFYVTPFSSVTEVYDKIIKDLERSIELLTEDESLMEAERTGRASGFVSARETHFNLYAAEATLARVYWMKGDLKNAKIYAKKVIDSQKFPLVDKTEVESMIQSKLSFKETIWGIYTRDFGTSMRALFIKSTGIDLASDWEDLYLDSEGPEGGMDYRRFWFDVDPDKDAVTCLKLINYEYLADPNAYDEPVILGINMIRIPEMYYIMAEALLDEDVDSATDYLDIVVKARGMIGFKDRVPARKLTLDDIMLERRKEYYAEGQEWFCMKRQNRDVFSIIGAMTLKGSDKIYCLPIPEEETNAR